LNIEALGVLEQEVFIVKRSIVNKIIEEAKNYSIRIILYFHHLDIGTQKIGKRRVENVMKSKNVCLGGI